MKKLRPTAIVNLVAAHLFWALSFLIAMRVDRQKYLDQLSGKVFSQLEYDLLVYFLGLLGALCWIGFCIAPKDNHA